ncbi:unnamed protein product [Rotaria sordida]|uniref:ubiquitinyl hydrolase 1 n=1 Tax=Rotaria sordida TaxID=392033 RepID=A0A818JJH1_9BILA|nr:unnamed protein product [Rotaria sordida]
MSSNPLEKYERLLTKEPQVNDIYVIVDIKWLEHWKRYVGIEKSDEEKVTKPGPIDFIQLMDQTTLNSSNEIQLRSDAIEGNDYTFIPYELYKDLAQTYKQNGPEIIRKAIPQGQDQIVIETFLIPLRLRESRCLNARTKQIYRSHRTRIEELKNDICNEHSIAPSSTHHLYSSEDENGLNWKLIDERLDLTLEDINLAKNAFITYESRTLSAHNASSFSTSKIHYTPALCGLSNLGTTSFMNSALQCLSNVSALTEYFLCDEYRKHINCDNPLGRKGKIALAYGELIHKMWSGKTNVSVPGFLRKSVAYYTYKCCGFTRKNPQEFMSFLLDGLHEDLNFFKEKSTIEKKDDDDGITDDSILAVEQWDNYRKGNRSKIHDLFHGQIKSVLQCLECQTSKRVFEPICTLGLPLLNKVETRTFKILYVRLNGQIKSYDIKSSVHGRMCNLVQDFCDRFQPKEKDTHEKEPAVIETGSEFNEINQYEEEVVEEEDFTKASDYDEHQPKPDYILAVEIHNHRIHLLYTDKHLLKSIVECDQIVFYEIPVSLKKENNDKILMPCVFREDDRNHKNFGLPFYVNIPRHNCKGSDIEEELQKTIGNFLPLSPTESSDKPLYTTSLLINQNYTGTYKLLNSCLDDHIDFNGKTTILVVDVASSIVEKYKKQEEEEDGKYSDKNHASSVASAIQICSQQKQSVTLFDWFNYFTKKKVLRKSDLWKCPQCNALKKATKKIDLWLLPKVLIIKLKDVNYTRYFRDDIDLLIDCPIQDLDLSQFVLNPAEKAKAKYDLIAVCNRIGNLSDEHYTTHAKSSLDKQWHTFNDSKISDVNVEDVINKAACILVYQQQQQPS